MSPNHEMPHEMLIDLLREVNRGIGKYVQEILAEHDIPVTNMIMARQIGKAPGITISALARKTGMAKSHVSNIIRELQQRGWVEKKEDAGDQRVIKLYLTPAAAEYLDTIRQDIRNKINELVADVPEQEALDLIKGLTDIKAALERNRK